MLKIPELKKNPKYLIKPIFWLIGILLGGIQAWSSRYQPSGDITAYLDMSDAYLRGDWEQAINGYFSPFYSWLLGFSLSALQPSTYWKFFVVKIVNFLMYIFSLGCFEFFLTESFFYYNQKLSKSIDNKYFIVPEWVWLVTGYLLFFWSALKLIGVGQDSPDMFVAGIMYLATALLLRIYIRSDSWFHFILLGMVLGIGYLTKTFMFPMALIFLGTGFFLIGNYRQAFPRILVAFLVFSFISTPFIYTLSKSKGYLTFGDNGKLNHAWYIDGIQAAYWQGSPPGSGTPKHPIARIFDNPTIYEFGMHFDKTTFPIWYDSSYWYEGMKSKFNLSNQIKVSVKNILFYYNQFLGALIFGYLILISMRGRFWLSLEDLARNWMFLIPAGLGLGLYMLGTDLLAAQPSMRYIAPLIVLLFAGVFLSVRLSNSQESKRLITGLTIGILILMSSQFTELWQPPGEPIFWKVAQGLNQLGIHSGDKVAVVQLRGRNGTKDYWARLAELTIVAEIPDTRSFWQTDAAKKSEIYQVVAKTGAKALVQKLDENTPDYMSVAGWRQINNTDYYVYLF